MASFLSSISEKVSRIQGSSRSTSKQQILLRNQEHKVLAKRLQALNQQRRQVGIENMESTSLGNHFSQTSLGWGVKALLKAGIVVGTTAAVYVFGKYLGHWKNDHPGRHNGNEKGDEITSRDQQEADISTTTLRDDKIAAGHHPSESCYDTVNKRQPSVRDQSHLEFEELEILDVDGTNEVRTERKKSLRQLLQKSTAPTLQNSIPDQLINSGEEFSLNLGNHPIFPNHELDIFDAKGQRLTLNVTLANGDPLPEGLMFFPPPVFPFNPVIIGSVDTPGDAMGVAIQDSTAFVADGKNGLQVIDISDPSKPSIIGSVYTPGHARDVTVSGSTAFVADEESGLQIVDISNPSNPSIISSVKIRGYAMGVTIQGSTAFVVGNDFQVIDISNPSNPSIISCMKTQYLTRDVSVIDSIALVIDALPLMREQDPINGLDVINISNLSNPSIIGSVGVAMGGMTDEASAVTVRGQTVFVLSTNELEVIDISDPSHPFIIGSVDTQFNPSGITVVGSTAFVSGSEGIQVIDISDLSKPSTIGSIPHRAKDVSVIGSMAFVAAGTKKNGFLITDLGFEGWLLKGTLFTTQSSSSYSFIVTAINEIGRATTSFTVSVEGASYWKLITTISLPIISGIGGLYFVYKKRGVIANFFKRKRESTSNRQAIHDDESEESHGLLDRAITIQEIECGSARQEPIKGP